MPIGDEDPEDAWDDGDDVRTKVALLARLLVTLAAVREVRNGLRIAWALGKIEQLRRARYAQWESVLVALLIGFTLLRDE